MPKKPTKRSYKLLNKNELYINRSRMDAGSYSEEIIKVAEMLKNFYNYLVEKVSKVFPNILPTSRLKRFIFRFIAVAGRYVYQGRQWILQLYTNRPYEKVFA